MRSFRDNKGRTWAIEINVWAVKKVRGLLNVNLTGLVDDGFEKLAELMKDTITVIDVIYVLCKDEADKAGVSDEDFGRAMFGDALAHAKDAFLEELTDFFEDRRIRESLRKVLSLSRSLQDQMMEQMTEQMDRIDLDAEVQKLSESLRSAPASSESIQAHSPITNSA
jgi:hypothetical protein